MTVENETHELYSWDARNRIWLAVSQGSEEEMDAAETRRYELAKKAGFHGAAFWVDEIGCPPGLPPRDLGAEVVS